MVSGRAHDYLKARESDHLGVNRIWGLTIVYEDNEVQNFRTVLANVAGAVTGGWPRNVRAYFDLAEQFRPDVVVSDFESWSYLFASTHGLPVISLDNMQVLTRCTHPPEVLAGHERDFQMAKRPGQGQAAGLLPLPHHHLLLARRAQAAHHPAPAVSCARDPGGASASRASTCSSTRPPSPTPICPSSSHGAGASAASTACGAT